MGEDHRAFIVKASRPGRKRQMGSPRRRWADNFSTDMHGYCDNGLKSSERPLRKFVSCGVTELEHNWVSPSN